MLKFKRGEVEVLLLSVWKGGRNSILPVARMLLTMVLAFQVVRYSSLR